MFFRKYLSHRAFILSAVFGIVFAAAFLMYPTSDLNLGTPPTYDNVCNTTLVITKATTCVAPKLLPKIDYFGGGYRYIRYWYTYGVWPQAIDYPLPDDTMFASASPLYFHPATASLWSMAIAGITIAFSYLVFMRRIFNKQKNQRGQLQ